MNKIYYNKRGAGSFSGVTKLYQAAKHLGVTVKDVEQFLSEQNVYTLYRPAKRRYPRKPLSVIGFGTTLFADLASFQNIARKNGNHHYLLVVIEALSRFVYVEKLKTKSAHNVLDGFRKIFKRLATRPWRLVTDSGTEFRNQYFQKYCDDQQIKLIFSQNLESHSFLAERVLKTLKGRLYKYFAFANTQRWVDVIDDIVFSYNNTVHSSTGVKPSQINLANEEVHIKNQNKKAKKLKKVHRYKINDIVRVALEKGAFTKGYQKTFSDKLYTITGLVKSKPPQYKLSHNGEELDANFYEHELTKSR